MSDLEKLQGTWNIVSVEVEGQIYPPAGAQIAIEGDRFVSLNMGAEFAGAMIVNEAAVPKSFDVLYDEGPHAGKASLGIYEFVGEEWKICLGLAGVGRPEGFVSKPGSGHALEILRKHAASAETAVADSDTPTVLEGRWRMTACIQDGQPMKKGMVAMVKRVFKGNRTTLQIGGKASSTSRFAIDGNRIDYTDLSQAGIFELSGNSLRSALAEPGGARPEDYSARPGDRRTVSEWERA